MSAKVLTERTGYGGKHDVVDRAAETLLDLAEPGERGVDPGEAPVRADRDVERTARGGFYPGPGKGAEADQDRARPGRQFAWAADE